MRADVQKSSSPVRFAMVASRLRCTALACRSYSLVRIPLGPPFHEWFGASLVVYDGYTAWRREECMVRRFKFTSKNTCSHDGPSSHSG